MTPVGRICATLVILLGAPMAQAWPGSIRWGYANCVTCHVNVAGGGLLTSYGRSVSRELLTTSGGARELQFAYGRLATPPWLLFGGDLRYDFSTAAGARTLHLRQADFEAAVTSGRWLLLASVGRVPSSGGESFDSRRHYLQFQATPQLSLRAGRFLPDYGLWNGDLGAATRRGLAWEQAEQSYAVELHAVGRRASASATVSFGRPWERDGQRDSGVTASAHVVLRRTRKLGVSFTRREQGSTTRAAGGLFAALGLGRHGQLLAEADVQRLTPQRGARPQWSLFSNVDVSREIFVRGLYAVAWQEFVRRDWRQPGRSSVTSGVGLRAFPRPHLELQLRWRWRDREALSAAYLRGLSAQVRFYP